MQHGLATLLRPTWKSFVGVWAVALVIVFFANESPPTASADANTAPISSTLKISFATGHGTKAVTALAPGDTFRRSYDLRLTTRQKIDANATLRITTVGEESLLDSHAADGLRVRIDRCTGVGGWKKRPVGAGMACDGGKVVNVLAETPVAKVKGKRVQIASITSGQAEHLLLTFHLPATAGNAFKNQHSILKFTFIAA